MGVNGLADLADNVFEAVYLDADGELLTEVDQHAVADRLGASAEDVDTAVGMLARRGLLLTPQTGPIAELSARGLLVYEDAARRSAEGSAAARALERIRERWQAIEWLYEKTGARPGVYVEYMSALGFGSHHWNTISSVLAFEGLMDVAGFEAALTPEGVLAWERRADGRPII